MFSMLLAAMWVLAAPDEKPTQHAILPASGWVVSGLPGGYRWEAEGTVVSSTSGQVAVDRLTAWTGEARHVTIEVKKAPCPSRSPTTSPAWPTIGYQSLREALPEQLVVMTCKLPDQEITLRFPAGTSRVPELLLEEADRWEAAVIGIHRAMSTGTIDLPGALALQARVTVEGDDVERLAAPMAVRVGTTSKSRGTLAIERGPGERWVVHALGAHDYLVLVAPVMAKVALQLIPFDPKVTCEVALAHALKGQSVTGDAPTMPGWEVGRTVGANAVAVCARTEKRGLVVFGGGRVPRAQWLPAATGVLSRLGEALARP